MNYLVQDGYRIYKPTDALKGVVVGIHGFSGSQNSQVLLMLGDALAAKGYALITFDLPCHGDHQKEERLSLEVCFDAVAQAVHYAQSMGADTSIFATSFGAYLTLLYLARTKATLAHVILRAPAVYMAESFDVLLKEKGYAQEQEVWQMGHEYPLYVDGKFVLDLKANALENLTFEGEVHVIQGQRDTIVDWRKNAAFFADKFGERAQIHYIPHANHFFDGTGERAQVIDIATHIIADED
jgi:hypothetical protein